MINISTVFIVHLNEYLVIGTIVFPVCKVYCLLIAIQPMSYRLSTTIRDINLNVFF